MAYARTGKTKQQVQWLVISRREIQFTSSFQKLRIFPYIYDECKIQCANELHFSNKTPPKKKFLHNF